MYKPSPQWVWCEGVRVHRMHKCIKKEEGQQDKLSVGEMGFTAHGCRSLPTVWKHPKAYSIQVVQKVQARGAAKWCTPTLHALTQDCAWSLIKITPRPNDIHM